MWTNLTVQIVISMKFCWNIFIVEQKLFSVVIFVSVLKKCLDIYNLNQYQLFSLKIITYSWKTYHKRILFFFLFKKPFQTRKLWQRFRDKICYLVNDRNLSFYWNRNRNNFYNLNRNRFTFWKNESLKEYPECSAKEAVLVIRTSGPFDRFFGSKRNIHDDQGRMGRNF